MNYEDAMMEQSREDLESAIVGRKIVEVVMGQYQKLQLVLDNGKVVTLQENAECCAYTTINGWRVDESAPDNVITNVTVNDGYSEWFILSEAAEVMRIDVDWSEGSGYYMYGFSIKVEEGES
jgi:hypothetical protein